MYMTLPGNNPPLSTTDFVAFDQGERSIEYFIIIHWVLVKSIEGLVFSFLDFPKHATYANAIADAFAI